MKVGLISFIVALSVVVVATMIGCTNNMSETADQFRAKNRQNLTKLFLGMTKDSMIVVMGTEKAQGKYWKGLVNGGYERQDYVNPYRTETLAGENVTLLVYLYYTDLKSADGAITDDELTPVVLRDDKVIGWGWMFLDDAVQKYEIRLR